MKIKARVTKTDHESCWYANRIGEEFDVTGYFEVKGMIHFIVRDLKEDDGIPCISAENCRLIIKGFEFDLVPKAIESTE